MRQNVNDDVSKVSQAPTPATNLFYIFVVSFVFYSFFFLFLSFFSFFFLHNLPTHFHKRGRWKKKHFIGKALQSISGNQVHHMAGIKRVNGASWLAVYLGHHYTISTSHVNVIGASCDLVDAFMDSYHSKFTSVNVHADTKCSFPWFWGQFTTVKMPCVIASWVSQITCVCKAKCHSLQAKYKVKTEAIVYNSYHIITFSKKTNFTEVTSSISYLIRNWMRGKPQGNPLINMEIQLPVSVSHDLTSQNFWNCDHNEEVLVNDLVSKLYIFCGIPVFGTSKRKEKKQIEKSKDKMSCLTKRETTFCSRYR